MIGEIHREREMTRRCSHCSHNGHNSRTCPNRGVKIFGVRLTDGSIRKSVSMGNLSHYAGSSGNSGSNTPRSPGDNQDPGGSVDEGYASEDFTPGSSSQCREWKRGVPWTEDEHRMFLLGLQKLGKGDWRGISRKFVVTRTPTQVASHAQKYFIRQSNVSRRKRRSSLFDIVAEEPIDAPSVASEELIAIEQQQPGTDNSKPRLDPPLDKECESMEAINCTNGDAIAKPGSLHYFYPGVYPAYFSTSFPIPVPFWPECSSEGAEKDRHEVIKPTAVHSREPINVDELLGMSKLTLGESLGDAAVPSLSLKLLDGSTRQSAFHPNPTSGCSSADTATSTKITTCGL